MILAMLTDIITQKLTEVFHLTKASSGSKGFGNQAGELWEKVQIRFAGKARHAKCKQY